MRKKDYLSRVRLPRQDKIALLTLPYLRAHFKYMPELGQVHWQDHRPRDHFLTRAAYHHYHVRSAGRRAGCCLTKPNGTKYWAVTIPLPGDAGIIGMRESRLAWLLVHGRWPMNDLDHIDNDGCNNKMGNLREATSAENHQNRSHSRNSKSGVIGVCYCNTYHLWIASVGIAGKKIRRYCKTREEAIKVRAELKARYHPFQPNDR